jgi:hypothetical protein
VESNKFKISCNLSQNEKNRRKGVRAPKNHEESPKSTEKALFPTGGGVFSERFQRGSAAAPGPAGRYSGGKRGVGGGFFILKIFWENERTKRKNLAARVSGSVILDAWYGHRGFTQSCLHLENGYT